VTQFYPVVVILLTEAAAWLQPVSNRKQVFVLVAAESTTSLFEIIERLPRLKMFRFFLAAPVAVVRVKAVSVKACAMPGATIIRPGVGVKYMVVEPVVVDRPISPLPEPFLAEVVPFNPALDNGSKLLRYLGRAFLDAVDCGNG
jgi:hypothetical protein